MLRVLKGHTGGGTVVALTPDGHRAISGSDDGTLRFWDLDSGPDASCVRGPHGGGQGGGDLPRRPPGCFGFQ
jgi:WD40 repeat protein